MATILLTYGVVDLLANDLLMRLQQEQDLKLMNCGDCLRPVNDAISVESVDCILFCAEDVNSMQIVEGLIRDNANLKVLLVGETDEVLLYEAIRAGVKGYLPSSISYELFKKALRVVSDGGIWFDRRVSAKIIHFYSQQSQAEQKGGKLALLSEREMEILECLARGLRNRAIAEMLFISESTVKTHLYRIYDKLGVKGRLAAVLALKETSNSY